MGSRPQRRSPAGKINIWINRIGHFVGSFLGVPGLAEMDDVLTKFPIIRGEWRLAPQAKVSSNQFWKVREGRISVGLMASGNVILELMYQEFLFGYNGLDHIPDRNQAHQLFVLDDR